MDQIQEQPNQSDAVEFYLRPIVDAEKTKEAGRTVHSDGVYVRISNPGDRTHEVNRPLRETDKVKYRLQWNAFQAEKPQDAASGTLLSVWGPISPAQVEDYRYLRVVTVEQLAGLSDSNITALGAGARAHRQQARDFLESAKSNAPLLRVQAELQEERTQRAVLEKTVKEQGERLEALMRGAVPEQPKQAARK